jgi:DNA-binding response OmpR family regulator
MDGLTVCEKLRAQAETAVLPIILLSARASPESVKEGMEAGATRYLGKPISREELIQTLRDVLENIPSA